MKLTVHRMIDCELCHKCTQLLKYWHIDYRVVFDIPEQNRPYPYITIELEYKQLVDWIAKEKIDWSD